MAEGQSSVTVSWFHGGQFLFRLVVFSMTVGVVGLAVFALEPAQFLLLLVGGSVLALILAYSLAVCLLNRTTVHLDPEGLVVEHGPLPWLSGPACLRNDILAFEVGRANDGLASVPGMLVRSALHWEYEWHPADLDGKTDSVFGVLTEAWSVEVATPRDGMIPLVTVSSRARAKELLTAFRRWHGGAIG